jgi:hypothetical protein
MAPGRSRDGAGTAESQLTDFELNRLKRIEENRERMKSLNLPAVVNELSKTTDKKPQQASQRGLSKKRTLTPLHERRRSSRIRGEAADGNEVVSEGAGGKVETKTMNAEEPEGPQDRHSKDELPFNSGSATTEEDAEFLSYLREEGRRSAACSAQPARSKPCKIKKSNSKIKSLSLREDDVAKVTKAGVTHLSAMPGSEEPLVVAAGDKKGNVGIWRVDAQEENSSSDGVFLFEPHYQYVSGLVWGPRSNSRLYTSSYDGSVRCLDVEKGCFTLAQSDEEVEYSSMNILGDVLYLGTNTGYLDAVDTRMSPSSRTVHSLHISEKKINTLDIDVSGQDNHLVASGTDCTVKVFDTRMVLKATSTPSPKKLSKPLQLGSHTRACQAAYYAPDGSGRILSTSFDDTVRIWQSKQKAGEELEDCVSIKHDNQTGRWVFPFRAVWSTDASSVIVGNMRRYLDVFHADSGSLVCQASSEFMTAIPSRNCCTESSVVAATASGRIHIFNVLR